MADQGFGASISFATGFFAQITGVDWSGITRAALNTTHMGTTNGRMTYLASDLIDSGQLEVTIWFNPSTTPPYASAAETCTLTMPIPTGQTVAATWACSAFMTDYKFSMPHDNLMSATATLKFSGTITITAGS